MAAKHNLRHCNMPAPLSETYPMIQQQMVVLGHWQYQFFNLYPCMWTLCMPVGKYISTWESNHVCICRSTNTLYMYLPHYTTVLAVPLGLFPLALNAHLHAIDEWCVTNTYYVFVRDDLEICTCWRVYTGSVFYCRCIRALVGFKYM